MDEISKITDDRLQDAIKLWQAMSDMSSRLLALEHVVRSVALQVPDLNAVMQHLLEERDRILDGATPTNAKSYAAEFERWHVSLLHLQRVVRKD